MIKKRDGTLAPYSFGNRWKDGRRVSRCPFSLTRRSLLDSLRTDIPLKALNLHFNANFSIVSQVNPHISLFFFSSRGAVGRPVSHRRGRGWRGGFIGSAVETYLKLDLNKWLKILHHLELLPRPLGQDWSRIWLQQFSGTITIWPKSRISDFYYILSDPTPERLARMLLVGQHSTFPKLLFVANRMKIERLIEEGLLLSGSEVKKVTDESTTDDNESLHMRGQELRNRVEPNLSFSEDDCGKRPSLLSPASPKRSSSAMEEFKRQSGVFFDDEDDPETDEGSNDGDSGIETAKVAN